MRNCIICSGAKHLNIIPTVEYTTRYFKNGELFVQILDTIRNQSVCIIQSFELPNTHLMELLLTVDAVKRAGAKTVTVIAPYFPYCRMDKKHAAGVPISAKVVCDMLKAVNVDRLITFDLHNEAIQGFLSNDIQFDHILMRGFFKHHLTARYGSLKDFVFCAPDAGSVKRVKKFANICGAKDMCVCIKHRPRDGEVSEIQMIGDVNHKKVIVADDMCDSGGTLAKVIDTLYDHGADDVVAVTTHGIFSYPSYKVMSNNKLYTTNSCFIHNYQYEDKYKKTGEKVVKPDTIEVLDLSDFIIEIINRVATNSKVGDLIDEWSG